MAYFAPYLDGFGLHMPTYEDRLEDLCEAYRGIFGPDAELSAAVPDYQLLSVFAKALDDTSALVLQAYNSRNPMYASGQALDLLLPQYGLIRQTGESDAEARSRIRNALAARGAGTADALAAALKALDGVSDARVYVNGTDMPDASGLPGHSLGVVVRGGEDEAVARIIFAKKAPGIGTWGSTAVNVPDARGDLHTVSFTRYAEKEIFVYVFVRLLEGGDRETVRNALQAPLAEYVNGLGLAVPLNVPQLYGVAYNAGAEASKTFIVTDIQISVPGETGTVRDLVPCGWNEQITVLPDNVLFYFT